MADRYLSYAQELMETFALETGLTGERAPRRYLWTDAHAVCNYLSLGRRLDDPAWIERAVALVDQVHEVLGKHRDDDPRTGWISGMAESEGRQHPTVGGLRIGKPKPERKPGDVYDPQSEWDQDGQYFHYLTKWVHALSAAANATGDDRYRGWALELVVAAHRSFRSTSGPPRLFWKMSIDLRHPLVPSSGLHDPLDGLVTCLALRARQPGAETEPLTAVISDLADLCRGVSWTTDDPLGVGGLLFDSARLAQLPQPSVSADFLQSILGDAQAGLAAIAGSNALTLPAGHRLAFRELGLAIGLAAVDVILAPRLGHETRPFVEQLVPYVGLGKIIESFWLEPSNRQNQTWEAHGDINTVMLATRLVPDVFLAI